MLKFKDIKGLFSPQFIVSQLRQLPPLETPIIDTIFTDKSQLPFPVVALEDIEMCLDELPFITRGGKSIALGGDSLEGKTIEPLSIRMNEGIKASDLINLYALDGTSREVWTKNKIDKMRRIYRKTLEALCAISISGKIVWPVKTEAGQFTTYTIDYGTPTELTIENQWDAEGAEIKHVFTSLKMMKKVLKANGYATNLEVWAGDKAYEALFGLTDSHPEKSSIPVSINEDYIDIAGFKVKDRSETYRNPETGDLHPVVAENEIVMISKDAGHKLVYCAVDDLDAKFRAIPFFIKPVKKDDPSAISLIGEGKPLPVVNVKGICKGKVVAAA